METVELKDNPRIRRIVGSLSRKRRAFVFYADSVELSGTYWDGGSRDSYYMVTESTGQVQPISGVAPPQFGGPRADPRVQVQPGTAVVRVGIFNGKPATPTVFLPKTGG